MIMGLAVNFGVMLLFAGFGLLFAWCVDQVDERRRSVLSDQIKRHV